MENEETIARKYCKHYGYHFKELVTSETLGDAVECRDQRGGSFIISQKAMQREVERLGL